MFDIKTRVILLLLLMSPVFVIAGEVTIAVLNFENNSIFHSETYEPLTKGLADILITELNQVQAVRVVERRHLQSILDEYRMSQSGLIPEESTIKIGQMLGAQHLVFGSYLVALKERVRIDVRIVEVETGLTILADEIEGKTNSVLGLIKKLSEKILKKLDIQLTRDEKRILNKSRKFDVEAVVLYAKGLDLEDEGRLNDAMASYRSALEKEPEFTLAKARLKALSE